MCLTPAIGRQRFRFCLPLLARARCEWLAFAIVMRAVDFRLPLHVVIAGRQRGTLAVVLRTGFHDNIFACHVLCGRMPTQTVCLTLAVGRPRLSNSLELSGFAYG